MALATSMNLLESSFKNSLEFGLLVNKAQHGALYSQLAAYVERLKWLAKQSNPTAASPKAKPAGPAAAPKAKSPTKAKPVQGYCIHCGNDLSFNTNRPYCKKDFNTWNKEPDHKENYCHACGQKRQTNMNKPVCLECYKSLTS